MGYRSKQEMITIFIIVILIILPLIHTYAAAAMAKIRRNIINPKVSKLFAVTLFTPNNIVRNNLPWEVENPVFKT